MFYLLLAVIVFGFGFLLYLYYRDQKQEKNSYRTNAFHICRIEALEERDFLSASPLGDFYNDDNDDYEPPYNPSDTYIEYNAYSNAAAQQNAPEMSAAADLNISLYTANPATVTAASDAYEINTNTAETAFLNTMQTFTFAAAFKVDSTAGWHYILCRD
ncbi:MAG: hypothetical protein LBH00_01450, partial [Planctomycetaceae bacterium]|nr:hypothetical protein [Planctomycetaceae bacterium]